jgi:hypothetical protein
MVELKVRRKLTTINQMRDRIDQFGWPVGVGVREPMKLPQMPSSNRLVASFIVAGVILWGAGVIALVFYVRAETSRSNARKELVDKCLVV